MFRQVPLSVERVILHIGHLQSDKSKYVQQAMRQFISRSNSQARSPLKAVEVYVDGIATSFNFDLFMRGDEGNKLTNVEEVKL